MSLERFKINGSTNIYSDMTAIPLKVAQGAENVAISYPIGTSGAPGIEELFPSILSGFRPIYGKDGRSDS